jgi:hypothetical protein
MKTSILGEPNVAITLPKLLVVLAVITVLAVLLLPLIMHPPKYPETRRVNYQQQTGQWFRIQEDKYSTADSRTNGGPTDITGSNAFRSLQVMSNGGQHAEDTPWPTRN